MKIVYIAPHLSTGGCPQYLLKKIQVLHKDHDVYCIEYSNHGGFTVQRNQIKEILSNKFFDLSEDKSKIMEVINKIQPEVVHLEEMPEYFMDNSVALKLYSKDRKYKLIETSHDSSFNPNSKIFYPDKILFVSKYQLETLRSIGVDMDVTEYPITVRPRKSREEALKVLALDPNKKHVINVGLFTPRKNQAEIVEYAKKLKNYPIQFHFIGNQADNFKHYWEPIMKDFPLNCTWWNERKDVDNFYQAADLFLFTSRGNNNDKETSPLVIREAISYNLPSLIYNLPVYLGMYDKYENIKYLNFDDLNDNCQKILSVLEIKPDQQMNQIIEKSEDIKIGYDRSANKIDYTSKYDIPNATVSVKDIDSKTVLYASQHDVLHANINYWIIPVPKQYRDFETDVLFGGMTVEVYSGEDLKYSTDFRIRNVSVNKPLLKTKNNITPTYNNYMEFFVHGVYEEFLKGKKFKTVVDVGANAGMWIEYVKHVAEYEKIYAVEPNLQALKTLRDTYTPDEVVIVDKALCSNDGELEFYIDPSNSTIGSIRKNHQESLTISHKVQGISFRTFLKEYNIDYIDLFKMDIEGGEYPFFDSMQKEDLDKIGTILVEYHMQAGQTIDKEVAILLALFRGAGFKYSLHHQHGGGGFIVATR
jgi:FkbM family methyltransferase